MKASNVAVLAVGLVGLLLIVRRVGLAAIADAARAELASTPASLQRVPGTITDYFAGRSPAEVLAAPGPLYQREVAQYPDETARGMRL